MPIISKKSESRLTPIPKCDSQIGKPIVLIPVPDLNSSQASKASSTSGATANAPSTSLSRMQRAALRPQGVFRKSRSASVIFELGSTLWSRSRRLMPRMNTLSLFWGIPKSEGERIKGSSVIMKSRLLSSSQITDQFFLLSARFLTFSNIKPLVSECASMMSRIEKNSFPLDPSLNPSCFPALLNGWHGKPAQTKSNVGRSEGLSIFVISPSIRVEG